MTLSAVISRDTRIIALLAIFAIPLFAMNTIKFESSISDTFSDSQCVTQQKAYHTLSGEGIDSLV